MKGYTGPISHPLQLEYYVMVLFLTLSHFQTRLLNMRESLKLKLFVFHFRPCYTNQIDDGLS